MKPLSDLSFNTRENNSKNQEQKKIKMNENVDISTHRTQRSFSPCVLLF